MTQPKVPTMKQVAEALAAPPICVSWQANIVRWSSIYACHRKEVTLTLNDGAHTRRRRNLGMGKRVPEDWAALLWTEDADIDVGEDDSREHEFVESVLGDDFTPQFSDHLERTFAKGTGAIDILISGLLRDEDGNLTADGDTRLSLDMVPVECIVPLTWTRNAITEVAFVTFGYGTFTAREHRDLGTAKAIINRTFVSQDDGRYVEVSDAMTMMVIEGAPPLFAIIRPAISNNLDQSSPYGISVFANAEDHIDTCNLIFDNLAEDFELGGKMVFVPDTMLRKDSSGKLIPPQKDKANLFVALQDPSGGQDKMGVTEHNPNLRVADNADGLNSALSLLSSAVGMGTERYVYRGESIATATQVISENSDLFRTRRKHMLVVYAALKRIVRAILWLGVNVLNQPLDVDASIEVRADDSVIEDDGSRIARGLTLFNAGVISQRTFLIDYLGMTDEDAEAEVTASAPATPLF